MAADEDEITRELRGLIEEGAIRQPLECPALLAAVPARLKPSDSSGTAVKAVLDAAVADTSNRYLRAARWALGPDWLTYDELWSVAKSASELEQGARISASARPENITTDEERQRAKEALAQNKIIRHKLAMRELSGKEGSARGFRDHIASTVQALKDAVLDLSKNDEPPPHDRSLNQLAMDVYTELPDPPFKVIRADPANPTKWDDVLDGVPLKPEHATLEAIIERRVEVDEQDMSELRFADWLTDQVGRRAVGFSGQAGDGKTSFLNRLAAKTCETHVFVRWSPQVRFDSRPVEQYRRELVAVLRDLNITIVPTVVVVYPLLGNVTASANDSLVLTLFDRAQQGDEIVVLVEGRHGPIARLKSRVSIVEVKLSSINESEAESLIELLTTAYGHVSQTYDVETLTRKWPNLHDFLSMGARDEQIQLMVHECPPVLVAMLRAVYGEVMWTTLTAELENLGEADQEAYFHVCLATAAYGSLPENLLRSLAPRADIQNRSNHDPWIEPRPWTHEARHQVIAQVVLEKASSRRRRLHKAIEDYCAPAVWTTDRMDALLRVTTAARRLDRVGTVEDFHRTRDDLLQALRHPLRGLGDFPQRLIQCYGTDYWALFDWARAVYSLIPDDFETGQNAKAKSQPSQVIRQLAIEIFTASAAAAPIDDQDRILLHKHYVEFERQYIAHELALNELLDQIAYFRIYMNHRWWSASYSLMLYRWSRWAFDLLDKDGITRLEGPEADSARVLYEVFLTTYHRSRNKLASRRNSGARRSEYLLRLIQNLYAQVPEHATAILKHAWEDSIASGNPHCELATLYVESELTKGRKRPSDEILNDAERTLWQAAGIAKGMGEPLLFLAMLLEDQGVGDRARLHVELEEARQYDGGRVNTAFLSHALALMEEDKTVRSALLEEASEGYRYHAGGGSHQFARVTFAWKSAWRELSRLNPVQGRRQQRQYELLQKK